MAGGVEIETHAGPLPAVRAVSTAPKTRGWAWRSWSGRGINRLERAGSRLPDRHLGVEAAEAVDVDVIAAQSPQRVGKEVLHRDGASVHAGPSAGRVAQAPNLTLSTTPSRARP